MHRAVAPYAEARSDHDIFAALADRLGVGEAFTEGRGERAWLAHLYERLARSACSGLDARRRASRSSGSAAPSSCPAAPTTR